MMETDNRNLSTKAHSHASKTNESAAHRRVHRRTSPAQLKELRRLAALHKALTELLVRLSSKVGGLAIRVFDGPFIGVSLPLVVCAVSRLLLNFSLTKPPEASPVCRVGPYLSDTHCFFANVSGGVVSYSGIC